MKPRKVLVQIEMTTAFIVRQLKERGHNFGQSYDAIHSVKVTPASRKPRTVRTDPAPNSQGGDGDRNLSSWDAGR